MVIKNKRAWTAIIEVFVSILLIAGIMTIIVNSNVVQKPKIGEQTYKDQSLTLKIIQMDDEMRTDILNNQVSEDINNTIKNTIPEYLECETKICELNSECNLNIIPEKEIYADSILITTDMINYNQKELKLWCWEK